MRKEKQIFTKGNISEQRKTTVRKWKQLCAKGNKYAAQTVTQTTAILFVYVCVQSIVLKFPMGLRKHLFQVSNPKNQEDPCDHLITKARLSLTH